MVFNPIGLLYQSSYGSRNVYECAQAGPSLFLADHQDDRRPDQPYVDPPVAAEGVATAKGVESVGKHRGL